MIELNDTAYCGICCLDCKNYKEQVPWIYARNVKDYPGWADRGAKIEGINK